MLRPLLLSHPFLVHRYGSDKPDLRYDLAFEDVSAAVAECGFKVFAGAVADGGSVKCIRVPEGKRISNTRIKPRGDIANEAVAAGRRVGAVAAGGRGGGCSSR